MPTRLLPGFQLNSLCVSGVENGRGRWRPISSPRSIVYPLCIRGRMLSPLRRSILLRRFWRSRPIAPWRCWDCRWRGNCPRPAGGGNRTDGCWLETLSNATTTDKAQTALLALNGLSVRSGQLSERLGYRFAASQAYGNILRTRLAGLKESRDLARIEPVELYRQPGGAGADHAVRPSRSG